MILNSLMIFSANLGHSRFSVPAAEFIGHGVEMDLAIMEQGGAFGKY